MTHSMVLHSGGFNVDLDSLIDYQAPEATKTYQPLSHFDFASMIYEAADSEGLTVYDSKWAVSHDGDRMFGMIQFDRELEGHRLGAVVRNSYDRSLAAGIGAGNRNFICDNLAITGRYKSIIKHTKNVDYQEEINAAIESMTFDMEAFVRKINYLKLEGIGVNDAKLLLFDAAFHSGLISTAHVVDILDEFVEPSFQEFADEPLNKYRLFQAVTHAAKIEEKPQRYERRLSQASELFNIN